LWKALSEIAPVDLILCYDRGFENGSTYSSYTGLHELDVDRFIPEGWPKIRAACPTAKYWLAGKNDPTTAKRWRAVPGVQVLGFVDNLAPLHSASCLSVCPLWTGAGTNIKVLKSLAFGRTCVVTTMGHRGYEDFLQSGDSLLVAADARGGSGELYPVDQ
jgi:hypothetical protein